MVKRKVSLVTVVALMILALVLNTPVALAQDGEIVIEYGQTVTGYVNNRAFEVLYKFRGDTGDVVAINMSPVGSTGGLTQPQLVLLNTAGDVLAHALYSNKAARLIAQLPSKSDYTIVATRASGRIGKSVGKFSLSLSKPEKLSVDAPVKGKIIYGDITATTGNYYAIDAKGPFKVAFQTTDGPFYPTVSVNILDGSILKSIGTLSGTGVSEGEIGVNGTLGAVYLVIVNGQLPNKNTAEYTVTLTATK